MKIARVTDSTASLPDVAPGAPWRVIPLEIEIDGARYREGPELTAAEFHHLMQEVNTPPVTLPPSTGTFVETYQALLANHDRVLSVHLSSRLSETIANARAAVERLGAGGRVTVFDSRLAGAAVGVLCAEAEARLARGEDVDAVTEALEAIVNATRSYFSVYTLDFLYLGGRLERQPRGASAGSADDRPILVLRDGRLELVERVVGDTTRVERMLELIGERFGGDEAVVTAIVHAGERGEAAAARLERALTRERPAAARAFRAPLGPVLCAHTGFDVCGVSVYPGALSALGS